MAGFTKIVLGVVWAGLAGLGFNYACQYEATAGKGSTASVWKGSPHWTLDATRPTTIVFAHPSCPCTKVTLDQLGEVVDRSPNRLRVIVCLVGGSSNGNLLKSPNALIAQKIADATLTVDPKGELAQRFNAVTSGQTFVFSAKGELLFRGGLTSMRGQYGPNQGIEAIESILSGETGSKEKTSPVFGCSLFSDPVSQ